MDAAGFLKKSGLSDEQLGKIWDISDPDGKGHLDKAGLFVACKMVALIQSDMPLTVDNARVECHAPNFGDATAPGAPVAKVAAKKGGSVNFLVKPEEKRKYDTLFKQLQPQEGKLPGDKVSNLILSRMWVNLILRFRSVKSWSDRSWPCRSLGKSGTCLT